MDNFSMFTMAWPEVEALARQNATVLWPLGVVEEHGGHLPLGTDAMIAQRIAEATCEAMRNMGHAALVAPPLYWGIADGATGAFPGTFSLRPETLKALLFDAAASLRAAGFQNVVGINAHGDMTHVRTICEGFREASAALGIHLYYQTFIDDCPGMGSRGDEPYILALPPFFDFCRVEGALEDERDVHAGAFETAMMREWFPDFTNLPLAEACKPTCLNEARFSRWCTVKDRAITPEGYCGDPSAHARIKVDLAAAAKFLATGIGDFLREK